MISLYFLSGLPRSGSTVLAAVLNQHPQLHVTPTSGLIDLMGGICQQWEQNPTMKVQEQNIDSLYSLLRSVAAAKYEHIQKPIVIDKSRGWPAPQIMATLEKAFGQPKIIATVRNVPDCAASFVRVAKPKDVPTFLREGGLIDHLKSSYTTLQAGYAAAPENFCIVDYDDLMDHPQEQLNRVLAFIGLEPFEFDLMAIEGSTVKERDEEAWGIPGLHTIRSVLERSTQDSHALLGGLYDQFCQPAFWKGETPESRPKQPIDLQLEASTRGDFEKGWEIACQIEKEKPEDNRAAYNRGWYLLRQGKLQEGMALLDRGRVEQVFGNRRPQTSAPIWDGHTTGTVLLNLEGGLGDQIHGVRWARDISRRGCRVIVACSGQLAGLFESVAGVSAVVQHEALFGVYHNFWVPAMSAVVPLGYEYKDISGRAYLVKPEVQKPTRMRIGLRWYGSQRFEHEHHKKFDPQLMFNAVKDMDADFISLQRDEGAEQRPEWCREVPLSHWGETRDAVASCDLVISACTSIAHLAGAMGVETWVISPVMPYYLWADGKSTSVWYDSVLLFRQEVFGEWEAPFNSIRGALRLKFNDIMSTTSI